MIQTPPAMTGSIGGTMRLILEALKSYRATLRLSHPTLGRDRFDAAQHKALRLWLDRDLPRVAAYAAPPRRLTDLPILDKAKLLADFAHYNRPAISADAVRRALETDCTVAGHTVGASTGTSGNRGFFIISDAERYRWLGAMLAKTMQGLLWRPQRVAILLPQNTRLYGSARSLPHLQLRFFALGEGVDHWRAGLEDFAPTVVVAPPKVLRHLVETGTRLAPRRIFSAAETLDPMDRQVIEAGFGLSLGQIYMATEGLLGVTCAAGRLHLAEESVFFEFEPVGGGLVSPLITSFGRQVQIMARYRLNDLLRLADQPCPCGAPQRVVDEVVGRMDDCFRLAGGGGAVLVTPDILRNAVVRADPGIMDFRILQQPDGTVELVLPPGIGAGPATAAKAGLEAALAGLGAPVTIALRSAPLPVDFSRKLRRVECRLPPGAAP
jgi:putative adenylate-forming enzyme